MSWAASCLSRCNNMDCLRYVDSPTFRLSAGEPKRSVFSNASLRRLTTCRSVSSAESATRSGPCWALVQHLCRQSATASVAPVIDYEIEERSGRLAATEL